MSERLEDSKIRIKLDRYFHKIFNPSHIAYTIFFFIEVLILIVIFFLGSTILGDIGLFLATMFSLSFIVVFFAAACTLHDVIPICHYVFGCDHQLHTMT